MIQKDHAKYQEHFGSWFCVPAITNWSLHCTILWSITLRPSSHLAREVEEECEYGEGNHNSQQKRAPSPFHHNLRLRQRRDGGPGQGGGGGRENGETGGLFQGGVELSDCVQRRRWCWWWWWALGSAAAYFYFYWSEGRVVGWTVPVSLQEAEPVVQGVWHKCIHLPIASDNNNCICEAIFAVDRVGPLGDTVISCECRLRVCVQDFQTDERGWKFWWLPWAVEGSGPVTDLPRRLEIRTQWILKKKRKTKTGMQLELCH